MKRCHIRHKMPPKCWLFAVRYLHETLSLLLMHNDVQEVCIFCATKVALFFTLINCYGNLYWTHNLVRSRLYSEFWFKIGCFCKFLYLEFVLKARQTLCWGNTLYMCSWLKSQMMLSCNISSTNYLLHSNWNLPAFQCWCIKCLNAF